MTQTTKGIDIPLFNPFNCPKISSLICNIFIFHISTNITYSIYNIFYLIISDNAINLPYKTGISILNSDSAIQMLKSEDLTLFKIWPPVDPKAGDIFLCSGDTHNLDFACDQMHWRSRGTHNLATKVPIVKARYYKRKINNTIVDFGKSCYSIKREGKFLTLIHYSGTNYEVKKEQSHGNRRYDKSRAHVRTAPTSLLNMAKSTDKPSNIYKNMVLNDTPGEYETVAKPKNLKQVQNQRYLDKKRNSYEYCEIANVIQINSELNSFVKDLQLLPNLAITVFNDLMIGELKKLYSKDSNVLLSYDTTYNMGNFYLSTLLFKQNFFSNQPGIPVGFLIHHKRDCESHNVLFRRMRMLIPNFNSSSTILVTDREKGILKSIKDNAPQANSLHCWNHLMTDIKYWLQKRKVSRKNIQEYRRNVKEILESSSLEDFQNKETSLKVNWSKEFSQYYFCSLRESISKNLKHRLLALGIYTEGSGITTNNSECLNSVLKRVKGPEFLKLDRMVITLNFVFTYYLREISRGYHNLGTYSLRPNFQDVTKLTLNQNVSKMAFDPEKIWKIVTDNEVKRLSPSSYLAKRNTFITKKILAKKLVEEGKVHLHSISSTYIVIGWNGKKHAVGFKPRSCSCGSDKQCIHILAAEIASNGSACFENQPALPITKLLKEYKREKNSGIKGPLSKFETDVEPLPDSSSEIDDVEPNLEDNLELISSNASSTPKFNSKFNNYNESSVPINDEKVVKTIGPLNVYEYDLDSLAPGGKLTDAIVDSLFLIMSQSIKETSYIKCKILDSTFHQIIDSHGIEKALNYSFMKELTKYDLIISPICKSDHWYLVIIDLGRRIIIELESLQRKISVHLQNYASIIESLESAEGSNLPPYGLYKPIDLPKQHGNDCGVHIAVYADILFSGSGSIPNVSMSGVRQELRNRILSASSSNYRQTDFVKPIQEQVTKNINRKIIERPITFSPPPKFRNTITYLRRAMKYEYESSFMVCNLKTDCLKPDLGTILHFCRGCRDWYHESCLEMCLTVQKNDNGSILNCNICSN